MRTLLALLFLLLTGPAWAQNPTCPTRPVTDSSNACASTAFVHDAIDTFGFPTIPNNVTMRDTPSTFAPYVIRLGYYSPGDSPQLVYASSPNPCTINGEFGDGGAQVPSSDGNCWIAQFPTNGYDPRFWGTVGDGTTDDSVAMGHFFAYLNALPLPDTGAEYFVSLQGLSIATSIPLNVPRDVTMKGGTFVALAGSHWCATDTSVPIPIPSPAGGASTIGRSTCGVLNILTYGITLEDIFVDVNRIPNVTGVYCLSTGNIQFINLNIRHWVSGGAGFISDFIFGTGACSAIHFNSQFQEWVSGVDAESDIASDQYGVALGIWSYDNTFHGGNFALTLVPIYLATSAATNIFLGSHPYNGPQNSGPWSNPNGILYDGYANNFDDTYLDSVPITIRVSSITNSQRPQITFRNTRALWDGGNSSFSGWVHFTTSVANTPLYSVQIDGSWPATNSSNPYTFATTGAGSWAFPSDILSRLSGFTGDAALYGPGGSTTWGMGSIDMLGGGSLQGNINSLNYIASTSYTLDLADSGRADIFNAGTPVTITAPATSTAGGSTLIQVPNTTATIQAASGGFINGLTVPLQLAQNKPYILNLVYGTGANANWTLTGPGIDAVAVPSLTGSCTGLGTPTGTSTGGTFVVANNCASGTVTMTFAYGAPHVWSCASVLDITTPADTLHPTFLGSTSLTLAGAIAAGDTIAYNNCVPY